MSVAPFGAPVVPLVNWTLMGSSNCNSPCSRASSATCDGPARPATSSNAIVPTLPPPPLPPPIWITTRRSGSPAACRSPGVLDASSGTSSDRIPR